MATEYKRPFITDYSGNGGMNKGHCLTAHSAMRAAFMRVIEQGDKATVTNAANNRDVARMHPMVRGGVTVGVYVWAYDNTVAKPKRTIIRRRA